MSNTYHINIGFNVNLGIDAPAELQTALQYFLQNWSDGRFNFSTELIRHGLTKAVEAATESAINHDKYKIHGEQMVSTATGKIVKREGAIRQGATSLAHLETQKAMKAVSVHLVGDLDCTSITLAPDFEPYPED